MQDAKMVARIRRKHRALRPEMDERMRRQWAAAEARELGWGGMTLVAHATGLSRPTISVGMKELQLPSKKRSAVAQRVRRSGGGRKRLLDVDAELALALEALIEPVTRGDPESPLRWTCRSTRRLAEKLTRQNHPVSDRTVATLLKEYGYSLQANRKTREGGSHPDRNAQFEYINACVLRFRKRSRPAISVDTKKKELVGDFKNGGREWRPKGTPEDGRGKPLVSVQTIVNLIASTKTRKGLVVKAEIDTNQYETTIKVTDEELARVKLKPHEFHGDWNYTIVPRKEL
ncbi:MAG: hypothetical protein A2V70_11385 [Planctomycetes bacterium RBG_13_63_9]|nr:MAG: hypothetical protein A2V70_11385 [Planctomycetes bacterium RBG_13_63_9]